MISPYCLPKNVMGSLNVNGGEELSSPDGPYRSLVLFPNGSSVDVSLGEVSGMNIIFLRYYNRFKFTILLCHIIQFCMLPQLFSM